MKNKCKIPFAVIFAIMISFIFKPIYALDIENGNPTIYILNEEDFLSFAKRASLQSYTSYENVILVNDLDFTGYVFTPVPVISGNFDGRNHEIRGIYFDGTGSKQGFCRINKGHIKNLNVVGKFSPTGSAKNIGMIAGENHGVIENCKTQGEIKAKINAGGIAGKNFEMSSLSATYKEFPVPLIKNCSSEVKITCTINAGGIAGENLGDIENCRNSGTINTSENQMNEVKIPTMEDIKNEFLGYGQESTLDVFTSAGGICGKNSGNIIASKNKGNVGYIHLGRNVGGITGLNNSIIERCENKGTIYGRQNIGGITGQFEPNVTLEFTTAKFSDLKDETSKLISLLNDANIQLNAVSGNALEKGSEINASLNSIENTLKNTGTNINKLSKEKMDALYIALKVINETNLDILKDYGEYSELILDDSDTARLFISDILDNINIAIENINENVDESNEEIQASKEVLLEQRDRFIELEKNFKNINNRIKENSNVIDEQLNNMNSGIDDLNTALLKVNDLTTLFLQMDDINTSLTQILSATSQLSKIFQGIFTESTMDIDKIIEVSFDVMEISSKELEKIANSLGEGTDDIINVNKAVQNNIEGTRSKLNSTLERLNKNTQKINELITDYLKVDNEEIGIIELILKEEYDFLNSSLYSSYDEVYKDLIYINSELNSLISESQTNMINVNSVNTAIIMSMDKINKIISEIIKVPEYSTENIYDYDGNLKKGTIAHSINNGIIKGDSHVGGISGEVSFDLENNPVNKFKENSNLWKDTKAYLRAIIYESKNNASISSKTDYAGGIVGRANTGVIAKSVNKGSIEGINYLGGITGYSSGKIENCNVLCDIKGKNNLGGITGYGEWIKYNNCMIRIYSDGEKLGAIAGEVKNHIENIENNNFVNEGLGGIDKISYDNISQPLPYEKFITQKGIPKYYSSIYVRFYDGKDLIKSVIVKYGESINENDIPPTPLNDDTYTEWADFVKTNITRSQDVNLEHKPFITTIEASAWENSYFLDQNKKPIFLAQGKFLPEDQLLIKEKILVNSSKYKNSKIYNYEIKTEGKVLNESYKIRVRLSEEETIKAIEKDKIKDMDFIMDGTYAVFSSRGEGDIIILSKTDKKKYMIYIGVSILILLAIIIFIIKPNKKDKIYKNKKGKSENLNNYI